MQPFPNASLYRFEIGAGADGGAKRGDGARRRTPRFHENEFDRSQIRQTLPRFKLREFNELVASHLNIDENIAHGLPRTKTPVVPA